MDLFADADTAAGASAIAAGLAAVSTLLSGLFGYLNAREKLRADRDAARDKLQFDADAVKMRADLDRLTVLTEECHQERDGLKAAVAAGAADRAQLHRTVDDLHQTIEDLRRTIEERTTERRVRDVPVVRDRRDPPSGRHRIPPPEPPK